MISGCENPPAVQPLGLDVTVVSRSVTATLEALAATLADGRVECRPGLRTIVRQLEFVLALG